MLKVRKCRAKGCNKPVYLGLELCEKCLEKEVAWLDKCYAEAGPIREPKDSPRAMGWVGGDGRP